MEQLVDQRYEPEFERIDVNTMENDCVLTKFQGRHGGGEDANYKTICEGMTAGGARTEYDVLTIRHRRFMNQGVRLSEILDFLHRIGWRYREIVCHFCRGYTVTYINPITNRPFN